MNIPKSLVKGSLPVRQGQALISDDFAKRFNVSVGDKVTLFGSTMNGSMMFKTFEVSGTIRFGNIDARQGSNIYGSSVMRSWLLTWKTVRVKFWDILKMGSMMI